MATDPPGLPLDYPDAWNIFGGSIHRDEYRGDLAAAEAAIVDTCSQMTTQDAQRLTKAYLLLSLHSILTGQYLRAEEILRRIQDNDSLSPDLRRRAEIQQKLITPPTDLLNAFDSHIDLPGIQTSILQTLYIGRFKQEPRFALHETDESKSEDLQFMTISWAKMLRSTAAKLRSGSPIRPSDDLTITRNQGFLSGLDALLAGFESGYTKRLRAQAARLQGLEGADGMLSSAQETYHLAGDTIGVATCHLVRGDWKVSPQYSNITSLNLVICESTTYNGHAQWDDLEDDLPCPDLHIPTADYEEAMKLFRDSNAYRGMAAIHCRRACLVMLGYIWSGESDILVNDEHDVQVAQDLDEGKRLSENAGDTPSVMLVAVYKLIWNLFRSPGTADTAEAAHIGRWGAENGCFRHPHDLGLLLLRLGNFIWRNKRLSDVALACLSAAQELFASLGAHGTEIQAQAARAEILGETLDLVNARTLYLNAEFKLLELEKTLNWISPFGLWKSLLAALKESLLGAMKSTFFYLGDQATLNRIASAIERSSSHRDNREATETQSVLFNAKLQYRNAIRKNEMTKAIICLEEGLVSLRKLSTVQSDNSTQFACINLYAELTRYEDAKDTLRKLHAAISTNADSLSVSLSTQNPYLRNKMLLRQTRTLCWLSILAQDFDLAHVYEENLRAMREEVGTATLGPGVSVRMTNAERLAAALVLEGRDQLQDALIEINRTIHLIDTEWTHIGDKDNKTAGFGHSDNVEAFNCAIRICFKMSGSAPKLVPSDIACEPRLAEESWDAQALVFAERAKARATLEALRSQAKIPREAAKALEDIEQLRSRIRKISEEGAKSAKDAARLSSQVEAAGVDTSTAKYRDARNRISMLRRAEKEREASLQKEQAALQALRRSAVARYPYLLTVHDKAQVRIAESEALRASIPKNTVVIEFCTMSNGFAIFAIDRDGIRHAQWICISYMELQRLVLDFTYHMKDQRLEDPKRQQKLPKIIKDLSSLLLGPVEKHLSGADAVIVVPSGCLFNFSFQVLEYRKRPLIFTHSVMQIPSLSIWAEVCGRKASGASKRSVFGVSNAVKRFEYGRMEALNVSKLFDVNLCVADRLTIDQFKVAAKSCEVVHVCAHGRFDHDAPLLSKIAVLDESLSIIDLAGVLGPASLVVFSACFSGFGKVLGSNDVYGFAQAVLSLGARAFIGSLWAADDGAALITMWVFYKQLTTGLESTNVAQALRAAQLRLLNMTASDLSTCVNEIAGTFREVDMESKRMVIGSNFGELCLEQLRMRDPNDFKDPFYWAPFMLVGDGFQRLTH